MRIFVRKMPVYDSVSITRQTWKKFAGNWLSLAALIYIAFAMVVAILGYLITPDSTPMANRQILEIATRKPGFSLEFLKLPRSEKVIQKGIFHRMLYGQRSPVQLVPLHSFEYKDSVLEITEFSGEEHVPGPVQAFPPESGVHPDQITRIKFWLGTDQFGRDVLSRLMIGTRVSFAVGFISVLISLIIGISVGAAGGYFRGRVDNFIVWLINVVWSIPTLLLVIAITFALGKGFWQIFVAVGLTMWVEVARVTRGQVMAVREKEYIESARALGLSNIRIIIRHILPNISGAIIVIAAANFATAILIEAGLSFLGIGVQPPMPSWGSMIRENYSYLILDAAYLAILPGIAIMLLVLSFMITGNGLRDAMDVKTVGTPGSK